MTRTPLYRDGVVVLEDYPVADTAVNDMRLSLLLDRFHEPAGHPRGGGRPPEERRAVVPHEGRADTDRLLDRADVHPAGFALRDHGWDRASRARRPTPEPITPSRTPK